MTLPQVRYSSFSLWTGLVHPQCPMPWKAADWATVMHCRGLLPQAPDWQLWEEDAGLDGLLIFTVSCEGKPDQSMRQGGAFSVVAPH